MAMAKKGARQRSNQVLAGVNRLGHARGLRIGFLFVVRRVALANGILGGGDLAVKIGRLQSGCPVRLYRSQGDARVALVGLFLRFAYRAALLIFFSPHSAMRCSVAAVSASCAVVTAASDVSTN
jgi:hypothetical protein